ncbi:MAG: hypothetical protein E7055_05490 [Lentisphaerae bacterium]|nr:hypothetical protein [Lentisphaerota bacterium]
MKKFISLLLLSSLLGGCTSVDSRQSSEKTNTAAKSKAGEKSVKADAKTGKTSGTVKTAISEAEMMYVKALREPNKIKRNELFKAARKALLAEAEQNKNYKAHLLLGYMADLGQGMKSDGIQAAQHYRAAADSGMVEAKIALAEFWRRNDIFLDEAVKQILSIPNYEDNPAALCVLGSIYYSMFENDKGFRILKKAYFSKNHTAATRLEVLKILHNAFEKFFRGNNYDAALKELKRADELESGNYLTPYLIGLVEIRRGNLAEAEKQFHLSWQRNPAVPETYRELAFLKARTGREDEAMDDIKVAYAVSGRKPEFQRAFLEICVLTKNQETLLAFTDRLLKEHPDRKDLRFVRLFALQLKRDYAKAYEDLMILGKDPKVAKDPAYLESFANVSSALGKYDDAVKANEAILKQGIRPVPALNLAELYIVTDQYDKALKLLGHPDLKKLKEPLINCVVPYLEACALLASGKKADDAVKRFKAAAPAFLASRKELSEWDVTMFRKWLKKAKLSDEVKKQIASMTDVFTTPIAQPAKAAPAVKKAAPAKESRQEQERPDLKKKTDANGSR